MIGVDVARYQGTIDFDKLKKEVDFISKYAKIEEIQENDYILAINRYLDQEKIEVIDIEKTLENI